LEIERKLLGALQDLDDAKSTHLDEEYLLKASPLASLAWCSADALTCTLVSEQELQSATP